MQKVLANSDFVAQIREREQFLSEEIEKRKGRLFKAPDGDLKIITNGNTKQYYKRLKGETNGTYLKKSASGMITELAQKRYDKRFVAAAEAELKSIRMFLQNYELKTSELATEFPPDLIGKMDIVDVAFDEYSNAWQNEAYIPKMIDDRVLVHITAKGERVRSKSEELIANQLFARKIPYKYECPVVMFDGEYRYPDFTILSPVTHDIVYWEHLGMMDNPEYVTANMKKLKGYEKSGIYLGKELLVTMESKSMPINTKSIDEFICKHFVR